MKLMVVDGNSILNRAYYGIRPLSTREGLYTHAVYGFITTLQRLLDEEEPGSGPGHRGHCGDRTEPDRTPPFGCGGIAGPDRRGSRQPLPKAAVEAPAPPPRGGMKLCCLSCAASHLSPVIWIMHGRAVLLRPPGGFFYLFYHVPFLFSTPCAKQEKEV